MAEETKVNGNGLAGNVDRTGCESTGTKSARLFRGQRVAVLVFSHYPSDPRPRREAETLAQLGLEVEVLSLRQRESDLRRERFNGVDVTRLPLRHWRGGKLGYIAQYAAFITACFFVLATRSFTRRYRLVHVHNMPDILVFAALVPRLLGARLILDLHDPMPELMMTIFGLERESFSVRLLRRLEKWSIRFAHAVLTPNLAFKRLFESRSCGPGKLRVVMNSPDEAIFEYRQRPDEPPTGRSFVIMYHGSLVERHGLDLAVHAVASLRKTIPQAELRIYGRSTPFIREVMDFVASRDLGDAVKYLGEKTLEEIVDAIDQCDVGIIPNRRSVFTELNMPTRIFEYLARGKAVIAPATLGIQDYFGSQELVFFEPGDGASLARQLEFVCRHPREVNEIVKRGQAIYRAHRWAAEMPVLADVAAELLKVDRSPGLGGVPSARPAAP